MVYSVSMIRIMIFLCMIYQESLRFTSVTLVRWFINIDVYKRQGVMSGVMHAPLTGVFLIAELTGGYDLFVPLMIVSVSSYLTIIAFEPHSIYSMRLAKRGQLLTHHKDCLLYTSRCV